jgi:hypothetical protein
MRLVWFTHETEFRPLIARLARRALLAVSPAKRMKERARRAAAIFKAFTLRTPEGLEIGVDVEAMLGRADSGDLGDDLSDLFVALGEAAAEHETGIVFLLDEVQFLDRAELEALIAALHQVSQRELPLTLAGAGLPQLPALPGAAKSYAERLFRFPTIDRPGEQAARDALELPARTEGVAYERAATDRIVTLTGGLPLLPAGVRDRCQSPRQESARQYSARCARSVAPWASRFLARSSGLARPRRSASAIQPRSPTCTGSTTRSGSPRCWRLPVRSWHWLQSARCRSTPSRPPPNRPRQPTQPHEADSRRQLHSDIAGLREPRLIPRAR